MRTYATEMSGDLTIRLLLHEMQVLAHDPFLADRFREAIEKGEGEVFRHFDLLHFLASLGLRPLEKFVLASFIITNISTNKIELHMHAASVITAEFDNAMLALSQNPSFEHDDLSPDQITKLLTTVLCDPPSDSPVLDASQRQQFIVAALHRYYKHVSTNLHHLLNHIRYYRVFIFSKKHC